jgi:hypothetical protein
LPRKALVRATGDKTSDTAGTSGEILGMIFVKIQKRLDINKDLSIIE